MIRIDYNRQDARFEMRGHAGTAPEGQDLICAAVSALGQTLLRNLEKAEAEAQIGHVEASREKGRLYIRVSCEGNYWHWRRSVNMMDWTLEGLKMIRETNPEAIEIMEVN